MPAAGVVDQGAFQHSPDVVAGGRTGRARLKNRPRGGPDSSQAPKASLPENWVREGGEVMKKNGHLRCFLKLSLKSHPSWVKPRQLKMVNATSGGGTHQGVLTNTFRLPASIVNRL